MGAAVLVGLGVIGFPLLFETQPRPIAVDIPIEIPSRETAATPGVPASKPAAAAPAVAASAAPPTTESTAAAPPAVASAPASAPVRVERTLPADAERPVAVPARPAPTPEQLRDAQRAQALLDGKPLPPPANPAGTDDSKPARYVVQAGAYTDASSLRDARQKVEKLGLKTYTQVIETSAGSRTRVRVGPFLTRDEAEAAAARIKSAGLAVSILSL